MACEYENDCKNYGKACFKCFSYALFQPHKEASKLASKSPSAHQAKQGADLERSGVKQYNRAAEAGRQAARQQLASGALPFALGDMVTEESLIAAIAEFKERGQQTASGEKQITIKKAWLDKLEEEARWMNKDHFFLPFSFKGDDKIYVVIDYNILLSYIQIIHFFIQRYKI